MKKLCLILILFSFMNRVGAQCLSGNYTIGGTTPDFSSFGDAVTALETRGVCGPVLFNVRPGTYTERNQIDSIPGTSFISDVTFTSENGDSSSVILQATGNNLSNWVLRISGADHIRLNKIHFKGLSTSYQVPCCDGYTHPSTTKNAVASTDFSPLYFSCGHSSTLNSSSISFFTNRNNN